jgi:hypothetical protein
MRSRIEGCNDWCLDCETEHRIAFGIAQKNNYCSVHCHRTSCRIEPGSANHCIFTCWLLSCVLFISAKLPFPWCLLLWKLTHRSICIAWSGFPQKPTPSASSLCFLTSFFFAFMCSLVCLFINFSKSNLRWRWMVSYFKKFLSRTSRKERPAQESKGVPLHVEPIVSCTHRTRLDEVMFRIISTVYSIPT